MSFPLSSVYPEQRKLENREQYLYEQMKEGLEKHGKHYTPKMRKWLKKMVKEHEDKQEKQSEPSTKPKYVGVPESSWLCR
jgi:ADP-heptose:LPS heptosyltransferase